MIGNDWDIILSEEFKKDYFQNIIKKLTILRKTKTIYPEPNNIFEALKQTPFQLTRVVIIGQDPYHGPKQANGLAFAVNPGIKYPPSLRNILKELESDLNTTVSQKPDFSKWSSQGVLMLNAILTVEAGKPASHHYLGWELFTDKIIEKLSQKKEKLIFILWGNYAISKTPLIAKHHIILKSAHPSPLSAYRGFFGSKPFSKVNSYLDNKINWNI